MSVHTHVCFSLCAIAGYNNLEVAEYLLQRGAEVNSQDKGGLIPLHNAASYGVSQGQHSHTFKHPSFTTLNPQTLKPRRNSPTAN